MRKIYTLLFLAAFCFPGMKLSAQGIDKKSTDEMVRKVESNRKTTAPFSVNFKENATYSLGNVQQAFSKYLGVRSGTDELRLKNHDASGGAMVIDRYQQYFKGIKVEHGNYLVSASNDKVNFIMGDFYDVDANTSTTPSLNEDAARAKAWIYTDGAVPADDDHPKGELVFVEYGLKPGVLDGKVFLAWKFLIFSRTKALSSEEVYVDAADGKVLFTNQLTMAGCYKKESLPATKTVMPAFQSFSKPAAKNTATKNLFFDVSPFASTIYSGVVANMVTRQVGGVWRLEALLASEGYPNHTRSVNHATVASFNTIAQYTTAINAATEVTDNDNNWTDAEFNNANRDNTALDVHWGAQRVYDYWKTRHNRLSWDGANGVINCFVHGDNNWDNAFWQGSSGINSMFYGDGSNVNGGFSTLTCLDVTGHEIGHGVCQSTAALAYNRESGGMNEGFSDIWGASIEHFGDPHETDAVPKSYFDIGEEIGLPYPNTPLRSMSNPNRFSQPDTYLGQYWVDATTAGCPTPSNANDQCGVHTNSGVLNYWFYLLVSGGTGTNDIGNGFEVPALGWVDAEVITFTGEKLLTSSANYAACRTAMINAATTLFGACSRQVEAVTRAWYAVGVGADFVPCSPQISFSTVSSSVSESAGAAGSTCGRGRLISVPLKISSAATGGNAVVSITASGGTASEGNTLDYYLPSNTVTFNAGDATDKTFNIWINDDNNIEPTETIELSIVGVNPNGGNATAANVYQKFKISVVDNDKAEEVGGTETHTVGVSNTTLNNTSPFHSISRSAITQYIIPAADLLAAGLKPNVALSSIVFNVVTKLSTQPFTGYTISLANTTQTSVATGFATGLTQVFNGDVTTVLGDNVFNLTGTPFMWDGSSNMAVQICFANATAGSGNDGTYGYTSANSGSTIWVAGANSRGCTLPFSGTNSTSFTPIFNFRQVIPTTAIETNTAENGAGSVANETGTSSDIIQYSAANKVIVRLKNNSQPLGCLTSSTWSLGSTPIWSGGFATIRGEKVDVTANSLTSSYTVTIYYAPAELGGNLPSSLKIFKTTATSLSGANSTNTVSANTTFRTSTDGSWHAFTATFTGIGKNAGENSAIFFVGSSFIVLPITIVDFNVQKAGTTSKLNWLIDQQSGVSRYTVERSSDGRTFTSLGNVNPTAASRSAYNFVDEHPNSGLNYYRIRIVNNDGSVKYTSVMVLDFSNIKALQVTPNPVTDHFTVQYNSAVGLRNITVLDVNGKKLAEFTPAAASGSLLVDASRYAAGVYIVRMTDKDNKIISQKIVKP